MTFPEFLESCYRAGFSGGALLSDPNISESFRKFYLAYLGKHYQASMSYLEQTEPKFNPDQILPGTKSIIVLLHPYRHRETESALKRGKFKIARYAWGRDYHHVMKKKLAKINKLPGEHRIVVDSTPLPERYLARLSGLGFIGKNGMLIHPHQGSYFFLVFVLSTKRYTAMLPEGYARNSPENISLPIPCNSIEADMETYCGDCSRCIDACPTGAIKSGSLLDSRLCISYQTIENKDKSSFRGKKHNWVFGCDICQSVCPYNKSGVFTLLPDSIPGKAQLSISAGNLDALQEEDLAGSSLKRAGLEKIRETISSLTMVFQKI